MSKAKAAIPLRGEKAKLPDGISLRRGYSWGMPEVRGIRTVVIADLFLAGASVANLASEYELPVEDIERALRFEGWQRRKRDVRAALIAQAGE